jgi:hypothetical protein
LSLRCRRGWLALVPLLVVISGLSAASARAYVIGGARWPHGVIRYYNADRPERSEVALAARAWNHSGAHVHFIATSRSTAQVTIEAWPKDAPNTNGPFGSGELGGATVGYIPPSTLTVGPDGRVVRGAHVWLKAVSVKHLRPPRLLAVTAVHELGHILGLGHSHTCATMDASLGYLCQPRSNEFYCSLLRPDDEAGAVALYGGRPQHVGPTQSCNYLPQPAPPIGLTGTYSAARGVVQLSWRAPAGVYYYGPSFSSSGRLVSGLTNSIEGYVLGQANGHCVTPTVTTASEAEPEKHGRQVRVTAYPSGPGRWCFAIRTSDQFEQLSAVREVWVNVPPFVTSVSPRRTRRRIGSGAASSL